MLAFFARPILFFIFILWPMGLWAYEQYTILYINSYHPGFYWSDQIYSSIHKTLNDSLKDHFDLRVEYLDSKRYSMNNQKEIFSHVQELWKQKYQGTTLDLIMVSDQDGYDFLMETKDDLFPSVPILFAGVEKPLPLDSSTTGIRSSHHLQQNFEFILKAVPQAQKIWVITDHSKTGLINYQKCLTVRQKLNQRIPIDFFHHGEGIDRDQLIQKIQALPPNEPLFFMDYSIDKANHVFPVSDVLTEITQASRAPVFSHVLLYMDYGVVGGLMRSGFLQGEQLAKTGLKILKGQYAWEGRTIEENALPFIDYPQAQRWQINISTLPAFTQILHSPIGLWEKYGQYLNYLLAFLLFQTILIVALALLYRHQRLLKIRASERESLFRSIFELAPFPCILTNSQATMVMVNQAFINKSGFSPDQIVGKKITEMYKSGYTVHELDAIHQKVLKEKWVINQPLQFMDNHNNIQDRYFSSSLLQYNNEPHVLSIILDLSEINRIQKQLDESEKRFTRIIEFLPISIGITNAEGQIIYLNRHFSETFGYTIQDIPNIQSWMEKAYPDLEYRQAGYKQWTKDIQATKNHIISPVRTYKINTKNGQSLSIDIAFSYIDQQLFTIFNDVTEQKKAEANLKDSEIRAKRQRSGLVQITLDPIMENMGFHNAMRHICAITSQTLNTHQVSIWLLENSQLRCFASYSTLHHSFESCHLLETSSFPEYMETIQNEQLLSSDDAIHDPRLKALAEQYLIPLKITSLLDAGILIDGKLAGIVCCEQLNTLKHWHSDEEAFIRNIATVVAQWILNNERRKNAHLALCKSQELEQLVYVASHDLQAPLVNIDGFSRELQISMNEMISVLQSQDSQCIDIKEAIFGMLPDFSRSLQQIHLNTQQMGGLLKGLLKIARLSREPLHFQILNTQDLVQKVIQSMKPALEASEVTVKQFELPPCKGDESQLRMVFKILFDNALQFKSPQRPLTIEISGRTEGDTALFSIKDNGIGIAKEHQTKIFELFHKLNPLENEGDGIGLTLARQILVHLDGTIRVESTEGIGTEFFINLPSS